MYKDLQENAFPNFFNTFFSVIQVEKKSYFFSMLFHVVSDKMLNNCDLNIGQNKHDNRAALMQSTFIL